MVGKGKNMPWSMQRAELPCSPCMALPGPLKLRLLMLHYLVDRDFVFPRFFAAAIVATFGTRGMCGLEVRCCVVGLID